MEGRPFGSIVAVILLLCAAAASGQDVEKRIIGYYTSWSVYEPDYHVSDIPADRVDSINYAFAKIEDGRIALGDPYADTEKYYEGDSWDPDSLRGCFHQLQILKSNHPHLKTLISVGGWTWSTYFSDVALTPESRALFASSCVEFIAEYGFDGVDIDWEYPVSGGLPDNITRPEDKENYTLLLAELRSQLDAAGDYLLTVAAPASPFVIENIEVDQIHLYLDWINVMTYDFHGPWGGDGDPVTNFNSPLFPASGDPLGEPFHSQFNLAAAVETYLAIGVPNEKLLAGLAFYGRGYGGVENQNDGLFAAYAGPSGMGTWESGVFDYWDLEQNYVDQAGYTLFRHEEANVPWLFNPEAQIMISYDDPASIAAKGAYIVGADLGGAMFWEFSADRDARLLDAIRAALADTAVAGTPEIASTEGAIRHSCTPNPSRGSVTIRYRLDGEAPVEVRIYDIQGRLVRNLPAGSSPVVWDGRSGRGEPVESGVYFYVIDSGALRATGRFVLIE